MTAARPAQSLRVDVVARGLFDRAALAAGADDAQLALRVCRELVEIEPDYSLRLRTRGPETARATVSTAEPPAPAPVGNAGDGIAMRSRFAGTCTACGGPIAAGAPIIYSPHSRTARHAGTCAG